MSAAATAKKACGYSAVDKYVTSGQVVGLGTGSTAYHAIVRLAERVSSGELKNIVCVATSRASSDEAVKRGLTVVTLDDLPEMGREPRVDIAIDGADEIDASRQLIKGRGAALFREKVVECDAKQFVVVADESKVVTSLGKGSLPVEIAQFCWQTTVHRLLKLDELKNGIERHEMRMDGDKMLVTDNGNYIVDLYFVHGKVTSDLRALNAAIKKCVGVLETGFFLDLAPKIIIGKDDGSIYEI